MITRTINARCATVIAKAISSGILFALIFVFMFFVGGGEGPPAVAQQTQHELEANYGRSDIPLVSMIRIYSPVSVGNGFHSRISYISDDVYADGTQESYSDKFRFIFARAVKNSGFLPIQRTTAKSHFEILLACNGTSVVDQLYGVRAAHIVIGGGKAKISATSRNLLSPSNVVNFKVDSERVVVPRSHLDQKVNPEWWKLFFKSGPAVFDSTLPELHRTCVIEAYRDGMYAFLWRASYHSDAAANVADGLWALVSEALPARSPMQYFPDLAFVPGGELETPAGTYRMSGFERQAWHSRRAAEFSGRLVTLDETPLYGTRPKLLTFRRFVAAAHNVFGDKVVIFSFTEGGGARAVFKAFETSKCKHKPDMVNIDYVVRSFAPPIRLTNRLHELLISEEFEGASGSEQDDETHTGGYFFELLSPQGKYMTRERRSLKEGVLFELNKLVEDIVKLMKTEGTVVSRKRLQDCGDPTAG